MIPGRPMAHLAIDCLVAARRPLTVALPVTELTGVRRLMHEGKGGEFLDRVSPVVAEVPKRIRGEVALGPKARHHNKNEDADEANNVFWH